MARKYVKRNSPEGVGRLEAGVKKLLAQLAAAEVVVADKRAKLDKLRALLPVQPVEADRTIPPHALDAIRQYVKETMPAYTEDLGGVEMAAGQNMTATEVLRRTKEKLENYPAPAFDPDKIPTPDDPPAESAELSPQDGMGVGRWA